MYIFFDPKKEGKGEEGKRKPDALTKLITMNKFAFSFL